ncbi:uncharacterized protein N7469_003235 [Penicillium citrinum]|uniref:CRAL-TRIO domain-containing protein n=1 Tax=Penicillium citrinum TaxID=5077 RepID=A0A9W9TW36_PENCI|nr:uncharacterized protein N7469_003235 [Penicillium citrinum]KAJ5241644.1 hypothetical protein N7469_003235 [Penicillium citrinum]
MNSDLAFPPEKDPSFEAFLRLCADKGLSSRPQGIADCDRCDGLSDSSTLLRFLTARKNDPNAALGQLQQSVDFRQDRDILRLYDVVDTEDFEQARRFYPHWTGRRNKEGLPICYFDISQLHKTALHSWEESRKSAGWSFSEFEAGGCPKPDMLQMASVFHDSLVRFVLPLCTMMPDRCHPSTPISSSIYLVDASELGLKQGWNLKSFAQEISWLLSTCYPETILKVFVCNAPSYFATVWKYLKKWVDPSTAEKIEVLNPNEVSDVLKQHIDNANIPTAFGGAFEFTHGSLPAPDQNILDRLSWESSHQTLPSGPLKFSQGIDGKLTAVAVGALQGAKRNDIIARIDSDEKN